MTVPVHEAELKEFALKVFLRHLYRQQSRSMIVHNDSFVAAKLGLEVSNTLMASVVSIAIRSGWVCRQRNSAARDYYDNPVTFQLTLKGRQHLARLA